MTTPINRLSAQTLAALSLLLVSATAMSAPLPNRGRPDITRTPPPGYDVRAAKAAPEDSWWQFEGRERRTYIELGLGMQGMADGGGAPASTTFLGMAATGRIVAGHWLMPWLAAEGRLGVGGGEDSGLFGLGSVNRTMWDLQAGARLAMPTFITPVLAAHLGYAYMDQAWSIRDSEGVHHGSDAVHSLMVGAEAGVQFNYKAFTFSAVGHISTPLVGSFHRSGDAIGDPTPEVGPEYFRVGGEARVGVRF